MGWGRHILTGLAALCVAAPVWAGPADDLLRICKASDGPGPAEAALTQTGWRTADRAALEPLRFDITVRHAVQEGLFFDSEDIAREMGFAEARTDHELDRMDTAGRYLLMPAPAHGYAFLSAGDDRLPDDLLCMIQLPQDDETAALADRIRHFTNEWNRHERSWGRAYTPGTPRDTESFLARLLTPLPDSVAYYEAYPDPIAAAMGQSPKANVTIFTYWTAGDR